MVYFADRIWVTGQNLSVWRFFLCLKCPVVSQKSHRFRTDFAPISFSPQRAALVWAFDSHPG